MPRITRSVSLLAILWCGGCASVFKCETSVEPDGRVRRAIYQPRRETLAGALADPGWRRQSAADRPDRLDGLGWDGAIDSVPEAANDDAHTYLVARGTFESATAIPDTIKFDLLADDRLDLVERELATTDYIFVTEYRWRESFANFVTRADMQTARAELLKLVISTQQLVLQSALGSDYETAALVDWLRTEGSTWFIESSDFYLEAARPPIGPPDDQARLRRGLIAIAERHGLKLTDEKGNPLAEEAIAERVEQFARALIQSRLRRKDGQPVDPNVVDLILRQFGLSAKPAEPDPDEKDNPFRAAAANVYSTEFGSTEGFERRVRALLARVLGVYFPIASQQFTFTLFMPGEVVATNGEILSDHGARWNFSNSDLNPLGLSMWCRSLARAGRLCARLLPAGALNSRQAMLDYVGLVSGNPGLYDALRQCEAVESLDPLLTFGKGRRPKTRAQWERLLFLLHLPIPPDSPPAKKPVS